MLPIEDETIKAKIKQTYRLQFLKDALAQILDEPTFSVLSSMIYFNQMEIIFYLQSHDYFVKILKLYKRPYPENSTLKKRRQGVKFIHNISLASNTFQTAQKKDMFSTLVNHGLLALLEFAISDINPKIRMLGTELLTSVIDLDPLLIRGYVNEQLSKLPANNGNSAIENNINTHRLLNNNNDSSSPLSPKSAQNNDNEINSNNSNTCSDDSTFILMKTLVSLFINDHDIGLKFQVLQALQCMLDTPANTSFMSFDESMHAQNHNEYALNNLFISTFYKRYGNEIFQIIKDFQISNSSSPTSLSDALVVRRRFSPLKRTLYEQVFDLLSFCIRTHGNLCRDYLAANSIWEGMSTIISNPSANNTIQLGAIRCAKQAVISQDDEYHNSLIKSGCVDSILTLLIKTENRNNLINSACLDFLKTLVLEEAVTICAYLIKNREVDLKVHLAYSNTVLELIRFVQLHESNIMQLQSVFASASSPSSSASSSSSSSSTNLLTVSTNASSPLPLSTAVAVASTSS